MALIDIQPKAFVCTPSSLLNSVPCLSCLSETDLWVGLVAVLALALDKTFDEALAESACFNCISQKERLQGMVTVLGNSLLGETVSPADIAAQIRCRCVPKSRLQAAALYLLCEGFTLSAQEQRG